jgi:hypothetical protein
MGSISFVCVKYCDKGNSFSIEYSSILIEHAPERRTSCHLAHPEGDQPSQGLGSFLACKIVSAYNKKLSNKLG